ncbi:MAG: tetratricopeptide repeat protein [Crocinitomicaceae bacterium]|jgi:tetratricopeptide (TPR) repeat protein
MPEKETLLYRLTDLMFEKQQTFLLLDELYEDEIISPFVRNIQIDSPYQQLLFEGVLSQYNHQNELVVSFTIEAYFHHLLAKVLQKDERYRSAESLLELIQNNNLLGINDGLSNLLIYDIENGNYSRLIEFVDLEIENDEIISICILPTIFSFQSNKVVESLKLLFENCTINDWLLLQKCHEKLFDLELHEIRNEITEYLLKINEKASIIYFEIISSGIAELNSKLSIDSLEKLVNSEINFNSKIYYNIAYCYERLMDSKKALEYYNKSLEHENPLKLDRIALLKQKIAWTYFNLGDYDKSLKLNEQALNIRINLFGKYNKYVAHSKNDLGLVWDAKKNSKKSINLIEEAIDILSKELGENIIDIGTSYYNLGNIYYSLKDSKKALFFFNKSILIYNRLIGENHLNLQNFYFSIGLVHYDNNNYLSALSYFEKSLKVVNIFLGEHHFESIIIHQWIGYSKYELNRFEDAIKSFLTSNKIEKNVYNYAYIGFCQNQLNNIEEGIRNLKNGLNYLTINSTNDEKEIIRLLAQKLNKENELPQWIKNIN